MLSQSIFQKNQFTLMHNSFQMESTLLNINSIQDLLYPLDLLLRQVKLH